VENVPLSLFEKTSARTLEMMQAELEQRVGSLRPQLCSLVRAVLSGDVYDRYCVWPAAWQRHGAVRHGLLAHSLRVVTLAHALADSYASVGLPYDADLVTAAGLLHDLGKLRTLPEIAGGALPESAAACDHVTRGIMMLHEGAWRAEPVVEAECLERLTHTILAHHGRKEWGAPVEPQTVEAWLLHLADLAESRLWAWSREEHE
jgi:3'-5' exoribonuclease